MEVMYVPNDEGLEEELFASVDALLEEEPQLPPPAERARLREAAGMTQLRLAKALKTTEQTVKNWENGRSSPRPPRLEAYQRLLEGWAARYPKDAAAVPAAAPAPAAVARPEAFTGPVAPETTEHEAAAQAPAAPERPATRRPVASSRRPAAQKAKPATDPRFPHGPLAVLDGDGSAYGVGGIVLDCPATTIP